MSDMSLKDYFVSSGMYSIIRAVVAAWIISLSVLTAQVYAHLQHAKPLEIQRQTMQEVEEEFVRRDTIAAELAAMKRQLDRIEDKLDRHLDP